MSANEQRRAHFHQEAKAKKEVGDVVAWQARRQGIKNLGPSTVTVTWFAPDKRKRDNDGLGPFLKAAKDALVQAGVWPDDNCFWVVEDRLAIKYDKENPRIEILIQEVE
jgi:crossover junction endodeoxyribonuclease RusA